MAQRLVGLFVVALAFGLLVALLHGLGFRESATVVRVFRHVPTMILATLGLPALAETKEEQSRGIGSIGVYLRWIVVVVGAAACLVLCVLGVSLILS